MTRPIDIVHKLCPRANANYVGAFEQGDDLFIAHQITTPLRLSHFLAQVFHESGGLTILRESGAYSAARLLQVFGVGHSSAAVTPAEAQRLAYNEKAIFERVYGLGNPSLAKRLGNTQPGDGYRYRGNGLMQTTGRYNHRIEGQRCGVDFENHPELVTSAEDALKPALGEWTRGSCNVYADRDDVLTISRIINLGNANSSTMPNGYDSRVVWLHRIKPVIDSVELKPVKPTVIAPSVPVQPPVVAPPKAKARSLSDVLVEAWSGFLAFLLKGKGQK